MKFKLIFLVLLFCFLYFIYCVLKVESSSVDSKAFIINSDLTQITKALNIHHEIYGFYPDESRWRLVLTGDSYGIDGERIIDSIPMDTYGEEYIYRYPSKCGRKDFDLYSKGENREDECGSGDDISFQF
ncbi:type II secretion system protein GspG [Pseudoalteromonas luteoviolacea]|uniref:type II secretion system protein GspG n=1 Tax=Pseudoalteromonas luteoviolacea TaxID=43657 RepID=UPI001B384990|nr:type II secretion system protein GspG [Pseudoalteromonas luteoviolacea]MBQ4814532.1 type II secretion system protein GspG [Pseudoalteromonas luteoviolacea]